MTHNLAGLVLALALATLTGLALLDEVLSDEFADMNVRPALEHKFKPRWPVGDYRYCLDKKNMPYRLEVLPGLGWDNLRNQVSGMVSFFNYSLCQTTEDGQYLIPDGVFVTPLKESKAALNSELIDHWSKYNSMTANAVNLGAHVSLGFAGISGSFSTENQDVKKHQVEDKAVTSRVQLRYGVYVSHLQPRSMQLHPTLKTMLLDIAAHIQSNNMPMARYLADLIIRDYGTHYITRVEAGGILAKLDHIKRSYVESGSASKQKIKTSASVSFFRAFGFDLSTLNLNEHNVSKSYEKNVEYSKLYTYGGPTVRENFSVAHWADNMFNNLVAIDRDGDPLHYRVTPESLPELPRELTFNLSTLVLKSLQLYYRNNAIRGCTNANSPNFDFQANLDDDSCTSLLTNFTFGGVYQTCQHKWPPLLDPCLGNTQKNPKTKGYSCPSGYTAILLHEGTFMTNCRRFCRWWWPFRKCYEHCKSGRYSMFWCAADGKVPRESGYLFGGIYSDTMNNLFTNSKKCPGHFVPQRFGPKGMYVCISDDYELDLRFSLPFGGFMSCEAGNPLAMTFRKGLAKMSMDSDSSAMPKHCPHGYSQHLAVIDGDCEILYCTKTGSLSNHGLPVIRRPPFHSRPPYDMAISFPLVIENNDTSRVYIRHESGDWTELTQSMFYNLSQKAEKTNVSSGALASLRMAMQTIDQVPSSSGGSGGGLSTGATAGISVGVTFLAGIAIVALFFRRRRNNTSLNGNRNDYQSFSL